MILKPAKPLTVFVGSTPIFADQKGVRSLESEPNQIVRQLFVIVQMGFAFVCDLEGNDMLLIESSRREPCKKLSLPLLQSCARLCTLLTREVTEFAALRQKFRIADFLQPGVFSGPVEAPRFLVLGFSLFLQVA